MNTVAATLKEYNQTIVEVSGHTDSVGSDAANQVLSERRANSVAGYLIGQGLMRERFEGIVEDPAQLGMMLAAVYAIASFSQVIVGRLIDRFAIKRLYLFIVLLQVPMFLLASHAQGWLLFWLQIGFMITVFGAIPFTDAMVRRGLAGGIFAGAGGEDCRLRQPFACHGADCLQYGLHRDLAARRNRSAAGTRHHLISINQ